MKKITIGNLVVTYGPNPLSIFGVMADFMNERPVLCVDVDQYGDEMACVTRLIDDNITNWSGDDNDWEEGSCVLFDKDVTYYSVIRLEVIQPQWYELPGAFAEPVLCIVSNRPIDPNKIVGSRPIRAVVGYTDGMFISIDPDDQHLIIEWKYALPIKVA